MEPTFVHITRVPLRNIIKVDYSLGLAGIAKAFGLNHSLELFKLTRKTGVRFFERKYFDFDHKHHYEMVNFMKHEGFRPARIEEFLAQSIPVPGDLENQPTCHSSRNDTTSYYGRTWATGSIIKDKESGIDRAPSIYHESRKGEYGSILHFELRTIGAFSVNKETIVGVRPVVNLDDLWDPSKKFEPM